MSMQQAILDVRNLQTHFFTGQGIARAVNDISFDLQAGEILGLVGESGCGKSMTGFSILGLVDAPGKVVGGQILFKGKDLLGMAPERLRHLRGNRIAMIFQDPMMTLNPVLRIDTQMIETLQAHQEISHAAAYARSLEVLGDAVLQRFAALLQKLCREQRTSLIWITHDLSVVAGLADRVAVMYAGKIVETGTVEATLDHPLHPYTQGLLGAIPALHERGRPLHLIQGATPSLINLPTGCAFGDRCPQVHAKCAVSPPVFTVDEGGQAHDVSCWLRQPMLEAMPQ